MSMQLTPEMEYYVDAIIERADSALKAAGFIRYRNKQALSNEQMDEIGTIHLNMASLLAHLTDGETYGAAPPSVIYALRGYECAANDLLREGQDCEELPHPTVRPTRHAMVKAVLTS